MVIVEVIFFCCSFYLWTVEYSVWKLFKKPVDIVEKIGTEATLLNYSEAITHSYDDTDLKKNCQPQQHLSAVLLERQFMSFLCGPFSPRL